MWRWRKPTTNWKGAEHQEGTDGHFECMIEWSTYNKELTSTTMWLVGKRGDTDRHVVNERTTSFADARDNIERNAAELWRNGKKGKRNIEDELLKPGIGPKFVDGIGEPPPPKPRAPRLNGAQRGCDHCPMQNEWPRLKTPRMPLSGIPDADVLIIGEAPGAEEDERGRPFVGPAGQVLQRMLPARHEARIAMTNALRCRPPRNRDPLAQELHACSLHLEHDIANRPIKAILGLGGAVLSRFLTGAGITQIHGLKFPVEIGGKVLWYYPALHPSYILHTGESRGSYDQSPALPILENDIQKFFDEIDTWRKPVIEQPDPGAVVCAYTEAEALHWLDQFDWEHVGPGNPIGLDIETNGLRPNTEGSLIMTAAISDGGLAVAWPLSHPEGANHWGLPLLLNIARYNRWVAHNAGFELGWLYQFARQAGIGDWEPHEGFDDSMAAARLFQRRETCLNLGILTRIYTGTNIKTLSTVNTERIANEPLTEVLRYNGLDAWGCWRIHDELRPQVDPANYQGILDTIASVTAMQLLGLDVDRAAAVTLRGEWQARADAAAAHAEHLPEVARYRTERMREFSIGSADQVGEALVDYANVPLPRNKDGSYTTNDATLTELCPDHPLALDALAYRHAKKMDSTYIEPLMTGPSQSGYVDRRIHPSYSTMLTRTFRLSSEAPNIQNYPKRKDRELRRPVVPPTGCIWASADFGQLEARIYAMASRDKALCKDLLNIGKFDIHSYWLDRVLDRYPRYIDRLRHMVTPNDTDRQVRKGGRDIIKSDFVFASFYGSTVRNVTDRTGIPFDIVTDLLGDFWKRYADAQAWLRAQRKQYRDYGLTRDLLGRERYGVMGGNECINTPVQGTAAALVNAAMNELHELARREKDLHLAPRINIHDDLTFALPDDTEVVMAYIDGISDILVKLRYPWQIVPLTVEWRLGPNWSDLEPVHEFTGDYVR